MARDRDGIGGNNTSPHLKAFIERIERIEVEQAALRDDKKAIYGEAKSAGFDAPAMRRLVAIRKLTPEDRAERRELDEPYEAATGTLDGTPLGDAARDRLDGVDRRNGKAPPVPPGNAPDAQDLPDAARARTKKPAPTPDLPDASRGATVPAERAETIEEARELGRTAAINGAPVSSNPFPPRDPRRAAWDEAWCQEIGSDGMEIPEAFRRKKKPEPEPEDDCVPADDCAPADADGHESIDDTSDDAGAAAAAAAPADGGAA